MTFGQRFRQSPAAAYCLVALLAGVYLLPFVRMLTTTVDEGTFLYGAQVVAQGGVPLRDFFEPSGPGSFYWLGMLFRLFGTTFLIARAALWCEGVATALLVFYLARRFGSSGFLPVLFVTATGIPWMVMNSPHYDSNLIVLVAVAVFFAAESRRRAALFWAAGALTGIASWFLQDKGALMAAAFVVAVLVLHRNRGVRPAALVAAGWCCGFGIEIAWYWHLGALHDLLYANFIWPASLYGAVNRVPYGFPLWTWIVQQIHIPRSLPVAVIAIFGIAVPYILVAALPLLSTACVALRRKVFHRHLAALWVIAAALFISECHRFDLTHLRSGEVLIVIAVCVLCERYPGRRSMWALRAVSLSLLLHASVLTIDALQHETAVPSRKGTLYSDRADHALAFLLTHTQPGENVFVYPYRPAYYFLADVRNPTSFSILMYGYNSGAQFREALRNVDEKRVRYVLWDASAPETLKAIFPAYKSPGFERQIMEPYLEANYRQLALLDGFRILERRN